jgi:pantoate--beta-alanine ligase
MDVITKIKDMQNISDMFRARNKMIGFVPTMGALHEGHASLIKKAVDENDIIVVSIFVNPIQFCPGEDYNSYPRNFEKDKILCKKLNVDIIFYPDVKEMYPEELLTTVNVDKITQRLCGAFRPGHFRGVTTVVIKLFNAVKPHTAYFGQKDYQQAIVIKKMVRDLNFDVKIVVLPTVREHDGLALSSRNLYLTSEERQQASLIFKMLQTAQMLLDKGEQDVRHIISCMKEIIKDASLIKPEYIEISHPETLQPLDKIKEEKVLVAVAVKVGDKARLIDNILWEKKGVIKGVI